jgi:cell volume regulation protein A
MQASHELILLGAGLGLCSIFAGLLFARIGGPLLLVFLVLGMLAGEDGPGGLQFDDFPAAYLIGSVALGVILFEGGLKTGRQTLRLAFWPALAMATLGVTLTTAIVGAVAAWVGGIALGQALLVGAAVAPTDAAAVAALLSRGRLAIPPRVTALLEVESGLNDPMSVFLTLLLVGMAGSDAGVGWPVVRRDLLLLASEMGGGAAFGIAGGLVMRGLLRRLPLDASLAPVFALTAALALFGAAQSLGASGFLAIYIAGLTTASGSHATRQAVEHFLEALAWLAQIVLFLMLGLLVTPHALPPVIVPALVAAAALIFLARPIASFACLLPFGFSGREIGFAAWVGLRGAVPIYLTIIPVLEGARDATGRFGEAFVLVIASLVIQGWTVQPAARLLGFGRAA